MSHLLLSAHKLSKEEARKITDQVRYRNFLHDREQETNNLDIEAAHNSTRKYILDEYTEDLAEEDWDDFLRSLC